MLLMERFGAHFLLALPVVHGKTFKAGLSFHYQDLLLKQTDPLFSHTNDRHTRDTP
ncbi:MAG: hypothetical protein ACI4O7_04225 [Aristaeellaceae bacterium]